MTPTPYALVIFAALFNGDGVAKVDVGIFPNYATCQNTKRDAMERVKKELGIKITDEIVSICYPVKNPKNKEEKLEWNINL